MGPVQTGTEGAPAAAKGRLALENESSFRSEGQAKLLSGQFGDGFI
jgi:hypothetical protein